MPNSTPSTTSAGALTATDVTKIQSVTANSALGGICIGKLIGANMNSTADQAITIGSGNYIIRRITVTNASVSLTTAVGGVYPTTSKGGTALVAAGQVYTTLSAPTKVLDATLATTDRQTVTTIYLSLTNPQGSTATADIYIWADKLD